MESYPDIEDFAELYGLAVNDPKVVQAYWDAKTAVLEYNNRQEYFETLEREAKERGHEQGLEQGLNQGIKRMAESLRAAGVDEDTIQAAIAASMQA